MQKRLTVDVAFAVGGYLGGNLSRVVNDVTLINPGPEYVEAIRAKGLGFPACLMKRQLANLFD
jgi:hypothetical protein